MFGSGYFANFSNCCWNTPHVIHRYTGRDLGPTNSLAGQDAEQSAIDKIGFSAHSHTLQNTYFLQQMEIV